MKIRTKFIISLILIIVIPAIATTMVTTNFLSDNLNFIHFFDTYYDIFNNFSKVSRDFEEFVTPYANTPEFFLSEQFRSESEAYSSSFLIIEVYENDTLYYSSYSDQIQYNNIFEKILYEGHLENAPQAKYSLQHHHYDRPNATSIDVKLLIDSTRLDMAYSLSERVFLMLYAVFNVAVLSIILSWISNPLKRSIRKLTFTTNEIGRGNLNANLEYYENDDFDELASSIERMRQSLKQSVEKQQTLELEKKEIIANISHDLRTPITSIRGYIQGLKDGVARTEIMQKEYLDTIEAKTYMIESLVNDLSVIAKYDQQGIQLNRQKINLRNFLYDCLDALESDVKKMGGSLSLHYIIKDTHILADPEKLMRVFINIIGNSIKYRSSDPLEIIILANQDDDGVFINISDNGIGLNEDDLNKVFERFYRSDKSRNLNIKGSGIGLSICKDIIESHGGRISAYSNDSKGLTVSIRLMAYDEE
ncbi:sensor histidine kinase [Fusibacter ferrireducens]|uniref:histidine kinase n=1 Tax=Fusibacter ferrireducens TaxID=2785058 RepID=A0ABR9ZUK3_9FIRM|nr:HAMP domain-containing sensor histidine kinase [Fusibacter ferrireducens]MBF4694118.1 HAMP domain-containing histidine kinase [Fusibacter ferrireducens]